MPWIGAAIGAGASLLGGAMGSSAAGRAADAQSRSAQQALELQRQIYNQNLGMSEPWRVTGQGSLNQLAQLFGLPYQGYQAPTPISSGGSGPALGARAILKLMKRGMSIEDIAGIGTLKNNSETLKKLAKHGFSAEDIRMLQGGPEQFNSQAQIYNQQGAPGSKGPDMSVFQASPDYQFRRDEGMRDIGNSFAARGGAFSGNALRGLSDFNSGLASQEFGNFVNRRLALAGLGQTGTQQAQNAGNNFAYQGGNSLQNAGDARASGIANQGNMWGQALGGAANAFGQYWGSRQPQFDANRFAYDSNAFLDSQFPAYG